MRVAVERDRARPEAYGDGWRRLVDDDGYRAVRVSVIRAADERPGRCAAWEVSEARPENQRSASRCAAGVNADDRAGCAMRASVIDTGVAVHRYRRVGL